MPELKEFEEANKAYEQYRVLLRDLIRNIKKDPYERRLKPSHTDRRIGELKESGHLFDSAAKDLLGFGLASEAEAQVSKQLASYEAE